ncbi:hypothetical protein BgiMline_033987 [Biomphalaria glabrata]|nr:hypothetical protein; partial [Biomphalaria glabrata]
MSVKARVIWKQTGRRPSSLPGSPPPSVHGTMYETGKTAQVAAEMKRYNLAILGISGSRWTGYGQKRLTSMELLLYSGHRQEATHTQGVALILSKQAQRALIGWEAHGPRIITASFHTVQKRINLDIVQCYTPTQCRRGLT